MKKEKIKAMQSDGLENQEYISVSDKGFYFTALGGVGEIGMNFGLYACDGRSNHFQLVTICNRFISL